MTGLLHALLLVAAWLAVIVALLRIATNANPWLYLATAVGLSLLVAVMSVRRYW